MKKLKWIRMGVMEMEAAMNFQGLFSFENKMKTIEERIKTLTQSMSSLNTMTAMPILSVQDNLTPVLDAAIDKMNQLGQMSVAAPIQSASSGNGAAASADKTVDLSKSISELADMFSDLHEFMDLFSEKEQNERVCNCICGSGSGGIRGKKKKSKGKRSGKTGNSNAAGKEGKRGKDGKNGKDGKDGKDGKSEKVGKKEDDKKESKKNKGDSRRTRKAKKGSLWKRVKGSVFNKAFKPKASTKFVKGLKVAAAGTKLLGKAVKPLGIVSDIATVLSSKNKSEALKKVGAENAGAFAGAAIGSLIAPGVGTVIGGIIGGATPGIIKYGKKFFNSKKQKGNAAASTPPPGQPASQTGANPSLPNASTPAQQPVYLSISSIGVDITTPDLDLKKIADEIADKILSQMIMGLQNRI